MMNHHRENVPKMRARRTHRGFDVVNDKTGCVIAHLPHARSGAKRGQGVRYTELPGRERDAVLFACAAELYTQSYRVVEEFSRVVQENPDGAPDWRAWEKVASAMRGLERVLSDASYGLPD